MGPDYGSACFWLAVLLALAGLCFIVWDETRKRRKSKKERTQKELDADWAYIERINREDRNGR